MKRRHTRRTRRNAFSLLEVLMVVVIIGILAAAVVPNFFGAEEDTKKKMADAAVTSGFSNAITLFRTHMGRYPETLEELFVAPDDEEEADKWAGPYIDNKKFEEFMDPWNNEWYYSGPEDAEGNPGKYDLGSNGPDGEWGTDDDIKNWDDN